MHCSWTTKILFTIIAAHVISAAEDKVCNADGSLCETILGQGKSYGKLKAISDWWAEMGQRKPVKCQGEPVYKSEFRAVKRNPMDVIFKSFKCIESMGFAVGFIPFSFKGQVQDYKFEGPGKFKRGVINTDESNTEHVCFSTKVLGGANITAIVGNFKNGVIHGNAKLEMSDGSVYIGRFVEGYRHGFFRHWNAQGELDELGYYYNEHIHGRLWQKIRSTDQVQLKSVTGQSVRSDVMEGSQVVHFMSNFSYAIAGINIQAITQHARYVNIDEIEISDCYLKPKWSRIPGEEFKFNAHTAEVRYYNAEKDPYPICKQNSWNAKDVSKSLKDWIRSLNITDYDSIWQAEPLSEPVQPDAPRLIHDIQHVADNNFTCRVLGSDHRIEFQSNFLHSTQTLDGIVNFSFHNLTGMPDLPIVNARFTRMYGLMKDGFLEGTVLMELEDTRYFTVKVTRNVMHGVANVLGAIPVFPRQREYYSDAHYAVFYAGHGMAGHFRQGMPEGHFWLGTHGGGYLYGKLDEEGKFTGNDIAFIYPDLETVIYGKFNDRKMIDGRKARITMEKCDDFGVKILKFSEPEGPSLFFSPPSNTSYGDGPRTVDPYEEKYVKLGQSKVPGGGEGVFAKLDVPKGQLVAIYSGIMFRNEEERMIYKERYTYNKSLTDDERRWSLKYSIGLGAHVARIEIPIEFDIPGSWMPSLGQKINCDFKDRGANVVFSHFDHPRYGLIMGVFAVRDIKAGEELFADYEYKKGDFPQDFLWYHEMKAKWEKEKEEMMRREDVEKNKVKTAKKSNKKKKKNKSKEYDEREN